MFGSYGYDSLCQLIEQCVTNTTYEEISNGKCLLIIAINEEVRMKKCMDRLLANQPEMKLTFIAQPSMEAVLEEWYGGRYQVVGWKGKYTLELVELLRNEIELSKLDGFLYFTEQPINLRDENFMGIGVRLQGIADIRVFSNTIGGDMYEYHDLGLYRQAIKVYEEVNRLIDVESGRRGKF